MSLSASFPYRDWPFGVGVPDDLSWAWCSWLPSLVLGTEAFGQPSQATVERRSPRKDGLSRIGGIGLDHPDGTQGRR